MENNSKLSRKTKQDFVQENVDIGEMIIIVKKKISEVGKIIISENKKHEEGDTVPIKVINDRVEKSFKAGYSAAIEDLIDRLDKWLKENPKIK